MIDVYKIGLGYYDKLKCDKNSGLFEYKIICKELEQIQGVCKAKVLVIINGLPDCDELENLMYKMQNYDKKIFVMSDSIALKTCKDIMNNCDLVLHQSITNKFDEINTKQKYSGVPELFYKYLSDMSLLTKLKDNKVSFGGNNLNRQDKFEQYNINDDIYKVNIKDYNTGVDARLEHKEYLSILSQQKFSLIICRKEYRGINWITARFYESIAKCTLPLIDEDFCKCLWLIFGNNIIRVNNFTDVKQAMQIDDDTRIKLLLNLNLKCKIRTTMFLDAIVKEVWC